MGGLRQSMPYTHATFLIGTLALVGIPIFAGLLVEGRDPRRDARRGRRARLDALRRRAPRRRSSPACTRSGSTSSSSTGSRPRSRMPTTAHAHHGEGSRWMLVPVGVLAVGSTFAGLLQIPGVWDPFDECLDPVVEPLVHPTTGQEWLTSAHRRDARRPRLLPRLAGVRGRSRARPGGRRPPDARAQALVRRAVRHGLRASGAGDRRPAPRPGRDAGRPGRPRRGRRRHARRAPASPRARRAGCSAPTPSRSRSPCRSWPSSSSWSAEPC